MTQLRSPFRFAVYGRSATPVIVSATGLEKERVRDKHAMRFLSWLTIPVNEVGLPTGEMLVYFDGGPAYWAASQDGGPTLSPTLENLFVLFVHGAASGWNVVEHRTLDRTDYENEIRVDKWHDPEGPDTLGQNFIPSKKRLRQLCKADLLAFYVHKYEEDGAHAEASAEDIKESEFWRFHYPNSLIEDVHKELLLEGFLDGHFKADWLKPAEKPSAVVIVDNEIQKTRSELQGIGTRESWIEVRSVKSADPKGVSAIARGDPRVFVIHGHDEARRYELVEILQDKLKLEVVVMKDKPGKSRAFIEKFEQEAATCNAAIAILTPDDVVQGDGETYRQPRPNVVYELGWFAGRCGRHRTLMVVKEGTSVPSDWLGIEQLRFRKSVEEVFLKLEREVGEWRGAVAESG